MPTHIQYIFNSLVVYRFIYLDMLKKCHTSTSAASKSVLLVQFGKHFRQSIRKGLSIR
uniref:Uncharacterized protein n=1 Tax=Arundo donax TaxID=35708 RepID=A0A0A8ZVH7_ARUDO